MANSDIKIKWVREDHPAAGWLGSFGEKLTGQDSEGTWGCDSETGNCQYLTAQSKNNPDKFGEDEVKTIAEEMNQICYKLGDCGGKTNWIGAYTEDGYAGYFNNKRLAGAGGAEVITKTKTNTAQAAGAIAGTSGTGTTDKTNANLDALSKIGGQVVKTSLVGNLIKWVGGQE
jgi:hypothetical protein